MVEAARRRAVELGLGNVDFRRLDAERLELDDASVNGVLNRFGYILKGDEPPALREIRRVLRPGGRLAFAVWAARELNPWMTVPVDVLVDRGHLDPPGEAEQRLSARRNPESIVRLLDEAGFGEPLIEELPVAYRFADAGELWFFVSELRGPVALKLEGLPEAERAAIRQEVEQRTPRVDDGFELGGLSVNVVVS
jgi:SAM-dependent methyltransferase